MSDNFNIPPRKQCVVGFAFYSDRVVLIIKAKPDWQRGKVNGVGGKGERGEWPQFAMVRAFREETGVNSHPGQWEPFAILNFSKAVVYFYRANFPEAIQATTQFSDSLEIIIHPRVTECLQDSRLLPNVRWLIPLAQHREPGRQIVEVNYATKN